MINNDILFQRKEFDTVDQAVDFFETMGLRRHHTSKAPGYVSAKGAGFAVPYKGRFGRGYKYYFHNPDSTYYCYVSYYVWEE